MTMAVADMLKIQHAYRDARAIAHGNGAGNEDAHLAGYIAAMRTVGWPLLPEGTHTAREAEFYERVEAYAKQLESGMSAKLTVVSAGKYESSNRIEIDCRVHEASIGPDYKNGGVEVFVDGECLKGDGELYGDEPNYDELARAAQMEEGYYFGVLDSEGEVTKEAGGPGRSIGD